MSYSVNVIAASKEEAITQVTAELGAIVKGQPAHSVDHAQALAAATSFVGVLAEPAAGMSLDISVSGSVSGYFGDTDVPSSFKPSAASISIGVGYVTTPVEKPSATA